MRGPADSSVARANMEIFFRAVASLGVVELMQGHRVSG